MQNIKVIIIIIILFLSSFLHSFLTLDDIGLTWDEEIYFRSSESYIKWFKGFSNIDRLKTQFDKDKIDLYLKGKLDFPTFGPFLMAITHILTKPFLGYINSFRISSVILSSMLICLVYLFMTKFYDRWTSLYASIFLLFLPRYFGHSHIAGLDIPTSFFSFLCVFTFVKGLENKKFAVIYGIVQGMAFATRFSLFIMPLILFLWGIIFNRKKLKYNLLSLLFISPMVFFILFPAIWYDTFHTFLEYIKINLNRPSWNRVPLYYLGKQYFWEYPYKEPIYYPWHYPYIMVLVTTPAIILINFFVGIIRVVKDKIGILLLLNFIIPLLIFTPTNIPKYDGERLFLQSFIFLCAIASIGFIYILNLANRISVGFKKIVVVGLFLILFLPFYNVKPFYLEYYNEFIGGVKGAHKKGFETTYWGNVVDEKFLNFLNKRVPPHSKVLFSPFSQEILEFYQKEGKLRKDIIVQAITLPKPWVLFEYDYLVLIARQGCFTKEMWTFYQKMSPVHTVSLNNVPLVMLYQLK